MTLPEKFSLYQMSSLPQSRRVRLPIPVDAEVAHVHTYQCCVVGVDGVWPGGRPDPQACLAYITASRRQFLERGHEVKARFV